MLALSLHVSLLHLLAKRSGPLFDSNNTDVVFVGSMPQVVCFGFVCSWGWVTQLGYRRVVSQEAPGRCVGVESSHFYLCGMDYEFQRWMLDSNQLLTAKLPLTQHSCANPPPSLSLPACLPFLPLSNAGSNNTTKQPPKLPGTTSSSATRCRPRPPAKAAERLDASSSSSWCNATPQVRRKHDPQDSAAVGQSMCHTGRITSTTPTSTTVTPTTSPCSFLPSPPCHQTIA